MAAVAAEQDWPTPPAQGRGRASMIRRRRQRGGASSLVLLTTTAAAVLGTTLAFVGRGFFPPSFGGTSSGSGIISSASSLEGRRGGGFLLPPVSLCNIMPSGPQGAQEKGRGRRGGAGGGGGREGGTALWMVRRETWTDIPLKDFYDALGIYLSTYGGKEVPEDFSVPFDASLWPERMQGLRLGKYFKKLVTDAELRDQDPDMVVRLEEELGIKVGLSDWDKFYQALTVFKRIKKSMKVLARFTIPAEEPWPEDLWNYRLGVRVGNLRTTGRFLTGISEETKEERVARLDDIGFEWKPRLPKKSLEDLDAWFNPIVDALKVYARMGGDIGDIKPSFVIPDSLEWPESLRGMALGQKLAYLRSRSGILNDHPEKKQMLQDLGLLLSSREAQNEEKFQLILLALETHKSLHGHCNVPQSFIVPDSDVWPEETRGMRLGVRVNAIRSQQTFIKNNPKRRHMLEALGFDTQPGKGQNRKGLDKNYEYVDEDGGRDGGRDGGKDPSLSFSSSVGKGGAEGGEEGEEGGAWEQSGPPRNTAEDLAALAAGGGLNGRQLTKDEILDIQKRAGLEWYFVNRQPGESWFKQVEELGLSNYPFVPLLSAEQHVKTKQKGELSLRGNRINPFFVIQPPALQQQASEVECYPTGSLLDTLAEQAAASLEAEGGDSLRMIQKLKEETYVSREDYRVKLVPDDDVDKETPAPWDEGEYWNALHATSEGEMDEFGEGGTFEDIIHALEVFKERYGHVRVPLEFEFESPSPEDDEDDWFSTWTGKAQTDEDWDSEAEPEFLKDAVSLSSTYDPDAASARRERRMERRQRDSLVGLFEGDEEGEEEGGEVDFAAIGSGLEGKDKGLDISFDFEDEDEEEVQDDEESETVQSVDDGVPTPEDDPYVLWPPEVEKLPLGDICFLLRSGVIAAKNVPERRAALDALGFEWGNDEAYIDLRWDVFLGTYYYWRLIKGVPLVPWEFIVPEEAPWPFFCRGVELGKMCDMIRRHQEVFFRYYPERVQTLEYFGWKWWWPSLEEGEEAEAPQPYNRYNNFEGMDLVLKLNFVDQQLLNDTQVPDFDALRKQIPESIPWREQDHQIGRESIVEANDAPSDMFLVPGLRRHQRRQALREEQRQQKGGQQQQERRGAKKEAAAVVAGWEQGGEGERKSEDAPPVKKTRGRKVGSVNAKKEKDETTAAGAVKSKRGRKPKVEDE